MNRNQVIPLFYSSRLCQKGLRILDYYVLVILFSNEARTSFFRYHKKMDPRDNSSSDESDPGSDISSSEMMMAFGDLESTTFDPYRYMA